MIGPAEINEMMAEFDERIAWTGAEPTSWPPTGSHGSAEQLFMAEVVTASIDGRSSATSTVVVLSATVERAAETLADACQPGARIKVTASSVAAAETVWRLGLRPGEVKYVD